MTLTNVYQIGNPYPDNDTTWNNAGNTCYLLRTDSPTPVHFIVARHTPRFYSLYNADQTGKREEKIGQSVSIRLLMEHNDLKLIQTPNAAPGQDTTNV